MKRIILVVDAMKFDSASFDFAAGIAQGSGEGLTCLFISDTSIGSIPEINALAGQMYVEVIVYDKEQQEARKATIDKNMALFYDECNKRDIVGVVLLKRGIPLDVILHESRFADLLVVAPTLSFIDEKNTPTGLVRDVLSGAECPVLLSAEVIHPVDEVIIAYDGGRSSAFAIKQFSYLLPDFRSKKVVVLHVTEEGKDDETSEYSKQFASWMEFHFPEFTMVHLQGNAADVLFNYFMEERDNNNKMLVAGAFGRSALSRFFNSSATDMVLKTVDIPVFIAHV
jgi:hypothetical protein